MQNKLGGCSCPTPFPGPPIPSLPRRGSHRGGVHSHPVGRHSCSLPHCFTKCASHLVEREAGSLAHSEEGPVQGEPRPVQPMDGELVGRDLLGPGGGGRPGQGSRGSAPEPLTLRHPPSPPGTPAHSPPAPQEGLEGPRPAGIVQHWYPRESRYQCSQSINTPESINAPLTAIGYQRF